MRKYCYVFFVTHKYFVMVDAEGDDVNEVKEIGVYASHQLAQCAAERFAGLPGFSSYPDRFIISKVRCYLGTSDKKADLSVLYSMRHICQSQTAILSAAASSMRIKRTLKPYCKDGSKTQSFDMQTENMQLWNMS